MKIMSSIRDLISAGGARQRAVLALLGLVAAAPLPALAQAAGAMTAERFAFDVADTDGDGLISEAEFARDAAAGFSSLDPDGDEMLDAADLGDPDAALFDRIDGSGDGNLTFGEVMTYKMQAFEAADTDGDGHLSFDEMMAAAEKQVGGE